MNCLRCNIENEEGVKFCKNCGMDMAYIPSKENKNSKSSDTFLIICIAIAFVSAIAQFTIQKLFDNLLESPIKYVQASFWLLQNLSFILIPLSIKNKTLKIVGLIISAIMVIYWVYKNIEFISR